MTRGAFYVGDQLALLDDGPLQGLIGVFQGAQLTRHDPVGPAEGLLLGDLDALQVVDDVLYLLLVHGAPSHRSPGGHGAVAPSIGDPVGDDVPVIAEEDVVESRRRPGDAHPGAFLHVAGHSSHPVGPVTAPAVGLGGAHQRRTPLHGLLVELVDEAQLTIGLAQVVDGQSDRQEG